MYVRTYDNQVGGKYSTKKKKVVGTCNRRRKTEPEYIYIYRYLNLTRVMFYQVILL